MADGIHYYPWYFNDWLGSGTRAEMSMEDRAIYRDLLDHQAAKGDLPDSVQALANMALCSIGQMQAFLDRWGDVLFPRGEDGRRRNAKLADARSAALDSRERRSLAGQKGAEVRWGGSHGNANGTPNGNANGKRASGFGSDSESSTGGGSKGGREPPPGFVRWWSLYPGRKAEKRRCVAIWLGQRAMADGEKRKLEPLADAICEAVEAQRKAKHWRGPDGKDYIPNASTWLYNGRWEDESAKSRRGGDPPPDPVAALDDAEFERLAKRAIGRLRQQSRKALDSLDEPKRQARVRQLVREELNQ